MGSDKWPLAVLATLGMSGRLWGRGEGSGPGLLARLREAWLLPGYRGIDTWPLAGSLGGS